MSITVHKGFFQDRAEIMADLAKTGYWPTTYVSEASPAVPLHTHKVDIMGYLVEGTDTWILDGESGERVTLQPGDKLEIPAGTLHAEGDVTSTTTYIVATSQAGQFIDLLQMVPPDDA